MPYSFVTDADRCQHCHRLLRAVRFNGEGFDISADGRVLDGEADDADLILEVKSPPFACELCGVGVSSLFTAIEEAE